MSTDEYETEAGACAIERLLLATQQMVDGLKRLSIAAREKRKARVVELLKSLPEAAAVGEAHLSLEVRGRRFGWLLDDHHGDGRLALNCRAESGTCERLLASGPERFHVPAYLGHRGWVGLWLDLPSVDWAEVHRLLADAYIMSAPRRLLAELDSPGSTARRR
jgi:hypothetical protein